MANQESFPVDPAGSPDLGVGGEGVDRRRFLKYGGMTAGALAVTPTVLSLGASPASASGSIEAQFGNSSSTLATTKTLTANGLLGTGLIVATIGIAGERSLTITSSTGNTWTAVHSVVSGSGLTMATYYTLLDGSQDTATITATWTTNARSVWAGTYFRTATEIHDSAGKYTVSSSTDITVPAGVAVPGGSAAVLFVAAVLRTASNTPVFTEPTDFEYVSNNIFQTYQATAPASGVGVSHTYQYPVPESADFGSTSASVATAIANAASMMSVV